MQTIKEEFSKEIYNFKNEEQNTRTWFKVIDDSIGTLKNGEITLLASRVASGKTSLLLNIILKNLYIKKRVLFFSLDLSKINILKRIVSMSSKIPLRSLEHATDFLLQEIEKLGDDINNLYIDETRYATIEHIVQTSHEMISNNINIIAIDYYQFIQSNRETNIARELKKLAIELNVPIILLSHLENSIDRREIKIPALKDIDDKHLEMEANNIIFLNSPVFYDETNISVMENTIKVIVAKSSYGTKEFEFIFKPYLGEFYHHHLIFSEAEKTRMQLTSHNYYEKCKSTFRYSDGLSNEILEDIFLLEVDKDAISRIPEDVFNLVNLTDLMIENNMIQSISKKIIKLENLVVLSLSNNQLEKLPDKIGALKYLKELHIQNNSTLISLPITFSKLKLQSLSIDGDLLSSQIEIIKNVTSLFSIVINGGTLSKEVLEYLEECYQLQRVEIIAIKNDHIPRVINNLIIREIDYETGALIYN